MCLALIVTVQQGAVRTFINPHGATHELLLTEDVEGVLYPPQPPSCDASWYPGYAWTCMMCRDCLHHLGWKFQRVTPDDLFTVEAMTLDCLAPSVAAQRNGWPDVFYGLRQQAVKWES